ncbi:MAG TPA: FkbM family methyltransferase [Ktedonobacteraceae bacterium]|nr:FkbM family methyltransferase [Ktedonobacteraceae bacterium]
MIRDRLIDTSIRLGIYEPAREVRAILRREYGKQRAERQQLHLLLQSLLKEDSNCIDIGAYRGRILAEIIRVAPRGNHIAYEPLPHLNQRLERRFPGVDVRQAAVSNENGETTFVYVKSLPAFSGLRERSYYGRQPVEKLTVRTETLDSSLPEGYVPSLIKIDVEGAERLVIEGAIKTITKYKPAIIFEHGKGGADYYNTQPRHIYELLHDQAGLQLFDMDGNGPYTLEQFEETFARNDRWDFVARSL